MKQPGLNPFCETPGHQTTTPEPGGSDHRDARQRQDAIPRKAGNGDPCEVKHDR